MSWKALSPTVTCHVLERFRDAYLPSRALDHEIKRLLFYGHGALRVEGKVLNLAGTVTRTEVQSLIHPDGQDPVALRRCDHERGESQSAPRPA